MKMAGIVQQLQHSALVKNPLSALFRDVPLTWPSFASQSRSRWFAHYFARVLPTFGVAVSFLRTTTQTACVHLPNTAEIRKTFSEERQKRLCTEHVQRAAFPALTLMAEEHLPALATGDDADLKTQEPLATGTQSGCPLLDIMGEVESQFVEHSDLRLQFLDHKDAKHDKDPVVVLWMTPSDRLKIIQYILQEYPAQVTSESRLPPLVLLLLVHLPLDEQRRLVPRLQLEIAYSHAIGGLVTGLPGFCWNERAAAAAAASAASGAATATTTVVSASPSRATPTSDFLYDDAGDSPMRAELTADLPKCVVCPLLSPASLVATLFVFWCNLMRLHSVRLEHWDGLLFSSVDACLSSVRKMHARSSVFESLADGVAEDVLPHPFACAHTLSLRARADDTKTLRRVRAGNHAFAQAVDGEAAQLCYMVAAQGTADERFASAARRGNAYLHAVGSTALRPGDRKWTPVEFKTMGVQKAVSYLLRHAHFFKAQQLCEFRDARKFEVTQDPLAALVIHDAHASDVVAGLETVLRPDQFFVACYALEAGKEGNYSGEYHTIVVARRSDIWLYQRYAALQFYAPMDARTLEAMHNQGLLVRRLPFAPTVMQLLESRLDSHRFAGLSVLREWSGFKRLTASDWNPALEAVARESLEIIHASTVCEALPWNEDVEFMTHFMRCAVAFDSRIVGDRKQADALDADPEIRLFWKPAAGDNPLAKLTVVAGSTKTFAEMEQSVLYRDLIRDMACIKTCRSADGKDDPLHQVSSLIDRVRTVRFEIKGAYAAAATADAVASVVSTEVLEPTCGKDTAYSRAGLQLQMSTAFPLSPAHDAWSTSACVLSKPRCTRLYGCVMTCEMLHFGYSAESIQRAFEHIEGVAKESTELTGIAHKCPAAYEFGLALSTSLKGTSVASPSTRCFIWKNTAVTGGVPDVPPSLALLQRDFNHPMLGELLCKYNELATQSQLYGAEMRNIEQARLAQAKHKFADLRIPDDPTTTTTTTTTTTEATAPDREEEEYDPAAPVTKRARRR